MSTRWARNFFGRLLGLKFVRALNNYSKWRRFWTSPVQVTKNLESSRLACTGIPSTTGSPKITKRSPNVERNYGKDFALKTKENRAARVVSSSSYDRRSVEILYELGWDNLETPRTRQLATIMYKLKNHIAPDHLAQILNSTISMYPCHQRNSNILI